jgi:hypothetical protein
LIYKKKQGAVREDLSSQPTVLHHRHTQAQSRGAMGALQHRGAGSEDLPQPTVEKLASKILVSGS